jgi:teichuronic acid biosynthesis glycosyltransferase TuaG
VQTEPLVSVIVPVYNRFPEADRAILSVINQSYGNWELIIIDDCSTEEYHYKCTNSEIEKRVTLIRNPNNLGPGLSRQTGLDLARGDYVCFLDSDDYYAPEFIERSVLVHKENQGIIASYTTSYYIDSQQVRNRSDASFEEIVPTILLGSRPWPTCSLLWRNRDLPRWRNLRTNQDYWFELDCAIINNKIKHIPDILCFIDKGTSYNTNDLVHENNRLLNRNLVYVYALNNINKYKSSHYTREQLIDIAVKRLVFSTEKILKFGNPDIVRNNIIIVKKFSVTHAIPLILVWLCSFNKLTWRTGAYITRQIYRI